MKKSKVKELLERLYEELDGDNEVFLGIYVDKEENIHTYSCGSMKDAQAAIACALDQAFDPKNQGHQERTFMGDAIACGVSTMMREGSTSSMMLSLKLASDLALHRIKEESKKEEHKPHNGHDCDKCGMNEICPLEDAIAWRKKRNKRANKRNNRHHNDEKGS